MLFRGNNKQINKQMEQMRDKKFLRKRWTIVGMHIMCHTSHPRPGCVLGVQYASSDTNPSRSYHLMELRTEFHGSAPDEILPLRSTRRLVTAWGLTGEGTVGLDCQIIGTTDEVKQGCGWDS